MLNARQWPSANSTGGCGIDGDCRCLGRTSPWPPTWVRRSAGRWAIGHPHVISYARPRVLSRKSSPRIIRESVLESRLGTTTWSGKIWRGSHVPESTIAYGAWFGSADGPPKRCWKRLATSQFLSDWGVRSMSLEDPRYGRHLVSDWIGVAIHDGLLHARRFAYHNASQGFNYVDVMTRLRTLGARGAMPESLSGAYYRLLDNGVPHQMFSELVAFPGLVDRLAGMGSGHSRRVSPSDPSSATHVAGRLRFANSLADKWQLRHCTPSDARGG